ncbi:MAG: hypothetical protein ACYC09_10960 [Bacteroidota bacterium]
MNKCFLFVLLTVLVYQFSYTQKQAISNQELKEVKELLIIIDNIDLKLQKVWHTENDYGLATDKDKIYFENVQNVSLRIADRIKNMPNGKYLLLLTNSVVGYLDVGKMRLLTTVEGGYDQQLLIATKYGVQDKEPHMWAYTIWGIARYLRNNAAIELGLPTIKYPK